MRIALIAPMYGIRRSEEHVIIRRIAGALACAGEVSILGVGREKTEEIDGAFRVIRFRGDRSSPSRKSLIRSILADLQADQDRPLESSGIPKVLQQETIRAEGGYSPELQEHLASSSYDFFVFFGLNNAATLMGIESVGAGDHLVVVPFARESSQLELQLFEEVFEPVPRFVVLTEGEKSLVEKKLGASGARVINVGYVVRVNPLSAATDPVGMDDRGVIVIGNSKSEDFPLAETVGYARLLQREFPKLTTLLLGNGWERFPIGQGLEPKRFTSRSDLWRWMTRSIAVWDPEPGRLAGSEVLESYLCGSPAIVRADGGAAREHAEAGGGGLWYRSFAELKGCVRQLNNSSLRKTLGSQGREYASSSYTDPDVFIGRVIDAVTGKGLA